MHAAKTARLCLGLVLGIACLHSAETLASVAPVCESVEGQWAEGPGYTVEQWNNGSEKLLVLGSGARVSVIDSSDPDDLQVLGFVDINESARYIDISPNGNVVAVSDRDNQIHLIDISNRSSPQLRGGYKPEMGRQPHGMDIVGNTLYAAVAPAGVWVINISNLDAPALLGFYIEMGTDQIFDLEVLGNYAYVADDLDGLRVVDISDPSDPEIVGEYAGATQASSVRIDGSTAYVARRDLGVDILDLSNAEAPAFIGNYNSSAISYRAEPLSGNRLAVPDDYNGTLVLDISTPATPVSAGSYTSQYAFALTAQANQVFVLSPGYQASVLRSLDFTTSNAPVLDDLLLLPGESVDVRSAGQTILVANGPYGMVLLDATDPEQPVFASRFETFYGATSVEWVNNVAVVGSFEQLDIVNISNPYSPTLIKSQSIPGGQSILDMDRAANRLFVALGSTGLRVFDMTNPASPSVLGTYQPVSDAVVRTAVQGNIAFTSDNTIVRAVNVTNPAATNELGSRTLPSRVQDMDYVGTNLFVATQVDGVRIFDVSTPGTFSELTPISTGPASPSGVAVSGNDLFIAAQEYSGLLVYDISNILSPQLVEQRNTPGEALRVDINGGLLSLAEGQNGVRSLVCGDLTPPGGDIFEDGFETLP